MMKLQNKNIKILITAFEPFGGHAVNPTEEILKTLTAPEGTELVRLLLPVEYTKSRELLLRAIREEQPGAVLSLGLAAGRKDITVERVAVNLRDSKSPDNDGMVCTDEPVVPGGPDAYFSTLPVKQIVSAMKERGISAELSNSAGTYVCNNVMYTALHENAQGARNILSGFLHIPATPEMAEDVPSLPLAHSRAAVETALQVIRLFISEP